MGKCKHHGVCGLEDANQPDGYLCILHSPDLYKGQDNFRQAPSPRIINRDRKSGYAFIAQILVPLGMGTFVWTRNFSPSTSKGVYSVRVWPGGLKLGGVPAVLLALDAGGFLLRL